ncbi:MAG TPA: 50S ribosomal protein L4, partial [Candidatus Acidoferrales bacterium]
GPRPRKYDYALPRKMRLGALRSALSAKLAGEKLTVVEGFELESHKTKPFRASLNKLGAEAGALLVDNAAPRNLELASRNLEGVKLVGAGQLETYDVLRHDRLVVSKDAALRLSASLAGLSVKAAPQAAPAAEAAPAKKAAKPRAPRKGAATKSKSKSKKKD